MNETIIEINDAIVVIDELLKGFGDRETWNLNGRGNIKKPELLKMKYDLIEARLRRIKLIIEQYSEID